MKRLFGLALCVGATLLYCTDGPPTPTGTSVSDLPTAAQENELRGSSSNSPPSVPELAPRQAVGDLIIEGNYGRCIQSTSYPLNFMSVFRVSERGSQGSGRVYRSGEGSILCEPLQLDCTVRDSDPTPGAISAYDLYDHYIGVLPCPPPPGCVGDCTPRKCEPDVSFDNTSEECYWDYDLCKWVCEPCEGEWEIVSQEITYEGECEDRIRITHTVYEHPCQGRRVEVTQEPAPEDCSTPECELPGPGSEQFEGGNPWPSELAECGNFGLVPGPGGFYITKCGLYFQWGPTFPDTHCSNGQEVSHITQCICEEE
jgi:hypothetical protein